MRRTSSRSALLIGAAFLATSLPVRGQRPPQPAVVNIPFADVAPILQVLRPELLPETLRGRTPGELERDWPRWAEARDTAIRERVVAGDEDSVIHLLLFGTSFTRRPRPTEQELGALVTSPADGLAALKSREDDFMAGLASPGADERLRFARGVIARAGVNPSEAESTRRYLDERIKEVAADSAAASNAVDAVGFAGTSTFYSERGLSSDTSLLVNYGIDRALEEAGRARSLAGTVRRVAIVGPGLDFTNKLEGYDFYPQQTIQPFAVIDSLARHELADARDFRIIAFDLSPRVIEHLEAARTRAAAGTSYAVVLPKPLDRTWTPGLVQYWQRFGDRVGAPAPAVTPPATAGRLEVRSVRVRPSFVLAITPRDLDVVVERAELAAGDKFDLVIATNILLYYDTFEQSLALANIASMLRPGGLLLTNTPLVILPGNPMRVVGSTDTVYTTGPQGDDTGDRIWWYER